jgi:hypothetical protein
MDLLPLLTQIVLNYSCRTGHNQCLQEFEQQLYEAACRNMTAVLKVKALAHEEWLTNYEKNKEIGR